MRLGQFPFGCLIDIFRQCVSLRVINGRTRLSAPPRMNSLQGRGTELRKKQSDCLFVRGHRSCGESFGVSSVVAVGGAREK